MMTWRERAVSVPAIPAGYDVQLANIESGNNPLAQNPNSSAKGRYQFIDSTAKQYGITAPFGTPEYAAQEQNAVKQFTLDNANSLRGTLGRDPTPGELYLAHQQGAGGAAKLLANPNARAIDIVGADAIKLNGGNENMTAAEFANKWLSKFDSNTPQYSSQTFTSSNGQDINMALMQPQQNSGGSDWRSRAIAVQPQQAPNVTNQVSLPVSAAAATSDWRSRAQPTQQNSATSTSDWRQRAQPVDTTSFSARFGEDRALREKQYQDAANATMFGEQTMGEGVAQAALAKASLVPDFIGEALMSVPGADKVAGAVHKGVEFIGKAPMIGGGTLGESLKRDIGNVSENMSPRTKRNLQAVGQAANIGLTFSGAGATKQGLESKFVKDIGTDLTTSAPRIPQFPGDTPVPKTSADLKKMAGQEYDIAEYLGAKFTPDQVGKPFSRALDEATPKPIAGKTLTTEDKDLINHLKEFDDVRGAALTLSDVQRINQSLNAKINKFIDPRTGVPDANGRTLMQLQTKLRDAIPEDVPGNAALSNANRLWKAQIAVDDINLVAERAAMTQNPATALQTGYRNLAMDKDRIRSWPKEAQDLLHQAATPGVGQEFLSLVTSRLPSLILGGTGNISAAATAHVVGMAGRGAKEAVIAKRGAKVQQSIVNDAMSKLRSYDVPAPDTTPLQLAAPDKMGPLPMTDTQINIARKLMDGAPAKGADTSGVAVKPPISQLTNLKQRIGKAKASELQGMSDMLKEGSMSQNQFVKEAATKFKLKEKQARSLAREIKSDGAKK